MAAVAGTKGRICTEECSEQSFQMTLAKGLLEGSIKNSEAAHLLSKSAKIREVGVDTNMVCNIDCSYCYLTDRVESKGTADLDQLNLFLQHQVREGAKLIAFIGKEPLADQRATTSMAKLNRLRPDYKFRTGMVTNGTLITRSIDALIEASPDYIDISIDGNEATNDALRGDGVYKRAVEGIDAILDSPLRKALSTTTVLWKESLEGFVEHVENMFEKGVQTCFGSPVLNFAVSNDSSDQAVSVEMVESLLLRLANRFPQNTESAGQQVMIDLPYKYTWAVLKSGLVPHSEVLEDRFEALFWRVPGSCVIVKLNPFSFSYFRAVRVTHDGTVIENMDLAAHENYRDGTRDLTRRLSVFCEPDFSEVSSAFHNEFLEGHLGPYRDSKPYDRALTAQHRAHQSRIRRSVTLLNVA